MSSSWPAEARLRVVSTQELRWPTVDGSDEHIRVRTEPLPGW